MTRKEYNGWANYETWNIALYLDNDQGGYEYWRERAQEAYNDASGDDRENDAANALATELEDSHEQEAEENAPKNGWMSDALNCFLQEVDWMEIAEHYISDVEKDKWEVIVGNVGTVYSGDSKETAQENYDEYERQSFTNYGRASGESVTLMLNGEIESEFIGTKNLGIEEESE